MSADTRDSEEVWSDWLDLLADPVTANEALGEIVASVRSRALAEATEAAEGAIADTTEARWTRDRIVDRLAALAAVTGEPE